MLLFHYLNPFLCALIVWFFPALQRFDGIFELWQIILFCDQQFIQGALGIVIGIDQRIGDQCLQRRMIAARDSSLYRQFFVFLGCVDLAHHVSRKFRKADRMDAGCVDQRSRRTDTVRIKFLNAAHAGDIRTEDLIRVVPQRVDQCDARFSISFSATRIAGQLVGGSSTVKNT